MRSAATREPLHQRLPTLALSLTLAAAGSPAVELMVTEGTDIALAASPARGELVVDLYGRLWALPVAGGTAVALTEPERTFREPAVSPDGRLIVATAAEAGHGDTAQDGPGGPPSHLWLVERDTGAARRLTDGPWRDRDPRWHPDGDRIVFASDRAGSYDLWTLEPASGALRQLTASRGEALEPSWSADGRALAWLEQGPAGWALRLSTDGAPARSLYRSQRELAAPSLRPDATVLSFLERGPGGYTLNMLILGPAPVAKTMAEGEDFFLHPAVWLDRERYLYTADGRLRARTFGAGRRRDLPFSAFVSVREEAHATAGYALQPLPEPHRGRYVLRAGRLFDGVRAEYRRGIDILIEDERILATGPAGRWPGELVLDFSSATVLPGLIDLDAAVDRADGPLLLASGVTTVALPAAGAGAPPAAEPPGWRAPGPRVAAVIANGRSGLATRLYPDIARGARLVSGAALPASPSGLRYQDVAGLLGAAGATVITNLSEHGLPEWEIRRLRASRQFRALVRGPWPGPVAERPVARTLGPALLAAGAKIAAGSAGAPPPGLALHGELALLETGGLPGWRALQAATLDAAATLGLPGELGTVDAGAYADLVIVGGDPLADVTTALEVVAVVRGGQFLSAAALLEHRKPAVSGYLTKYGRP